MRLRFPLLFARLAACGSLLHAAPQVPLSAFAEATRFSMPRLSPDGKYIALTVDTAGAGGQTSRALTIYSLPEMKIAGAIAIPKFHLPKRYFWTGPTRLFIITAKEIDSWEPQSGKLGQLYQPLGLSSDGTELASLHSADGGPEQLIKENLATGARTTLFADPRGDVEPISTGVHVGLPFASSNVIGIPVAHYIDGGNEGDQQLHKLLVAQFPGRFVTFPDATRDRKTVVFRVDSDRQPAEFYLLYRDTMKADLLFPVREKIVAKEMAARRPIAFKARDGLDLHGYLTLPQRPAGATLPLVVMPHDGPAHHYDSWFFDRDAQFLASRGYAVLQVNFRGSGWLGKNFQEAGYRQWGGKIQDDLVDGIKWAVAQGDVDGGRICPYGLGFGAYSALMLAAREPALIKCAVGRGGFYDLNLLYKPVIEEQKAQVAKTCEKQIGRDKAELDRISPLTQANRIIAPVLLVHGGKDTVASPGHATAMRAALVKAGRAPEWLVAADEGHGFYDPANVILFYQKLEAFLGQHLGQ